MSVSFRPNCPEIVYEIMFLFRLFIFSPQCLPPLQRQVPHHGECNGRCFGYWHHGTHLQERLLERGRWGELRLFSLQRVTGSYTNLVLSLITEKIHMCICIQSRKVRTDHKWSLEICLETSSHDRCEVWSSQSCPLVIGPFTIDVLQGMARAAFASSKL